MGNQRGIGQWDSAIGSSGATKPRLTWPGWGEFLKTVPEMAIVFVGHGKMSKLKST